MTPPNAPTALSLTEKQSRFEYLAAKLIVECNINGIFPVSYRWRSTLAEDLAYFNQGLSEIDPRKTPTMHMLGLARDFYLVIDGKADWANTAAYQKFSGIVTSIVGLKSGGTWVTLKDWGHVEYQEES